MIVYSGDRALNLTVPLVAMEPPVGTAHAAVAVPFYVHTGKHMAQRRRRSLSASSRRPTRRFRTRPSTLCGLTGWCWASRRAREISLRFEVKRPGSVLDLVAVKMDFRYEDWFPKEPNVGYETLIHDVMIGDQTLFMRADMVEQAWRIVLDAWTAEKAGVPNYDSGGDGPAAADELLARDGERIWRPVMTSLQQT